MPDRAEFTMREIMQFIAESFNVNVDDSDDITAMVQKALDGQKRDLVNQTSTRAPVSYYNVIPINTLDSLKRYADQHVPTGSFLKAVLENNLKEAVGRADIENLNALPQIVCYIYNEMPSACQGSPQEVINWLFPEEEGE